MTRVETKLIELRKEILGKRSLAFAEALPDAPDGLRGRMMAMVNAYDVCLIEIDKMINENRGEILKGGE